MTDRIVAYQHGIYPRSEDVVVATRGLERSRTSQRDVDDRFEADLADFVRLQREASLDYYSDGLLRWQDIFRPLVEASGGMHARTLVRWFDNNSFFRAPEITDRPSHEGGLPPVFEPAGVPEPRVATLPSPYLFSRAAVTQEDRNALMLDLARNVLRPVVQGLAARGYGLIHLQEPWLAFHGMEPTDWDNFEKALLELRDAVPSGPTVIVLHTYFGDAAPFVDRLRRLPVDAIGVDLVETDLDALGSGWEVGLLAGCLDGRRSPAESLDGTAEIVRAVADRVQPPTLYLSSNCELEFLPRDVAARKVLRLGEVARLVRETL